MIKYLSISNFALIDNIKIDFSKGFTCIIGETGAGKSIILEAISLLLGERADTKMLFNKDEKCVVEASFLLPDSFDSTFFLENDLDFDNECIIRRELSSQGKSRIFINDTPVSLGALKCLSCMLIDLHTQFQKFSLSSNLQQLKYLDSFILNNKAITNYEAIYADYSACCEKKTILQKQYESLAKEKDYNLFLLTELNDSNLYEDEDQFLEKELYLLDNIEFIKNNLSILTGIISENEDANMVSLTANANGVLKQLVSFIDNGSFIYERMNGLLIEIKDIANDLSKKQEQISFDNNKSEEIRNRLNYINKLLFKHKKNTVNELIALKNELSASVDSTDNIYNEIVFIEKEISNLYEKLKENAKILSLLRKEQSEKMSKQMSDFLFEVGLLKDCFKIEISELDKYSETGNDNVDFLFSANVGSPYFPLSDVASGGELSRVMLALKSAIANKHNIPTLIFDEIDSGISGLTAATVAKKLKEISGSVQVIVISHLPQIAAKADEQFLVYKDSDNERTYTHVKKLNREERIQNIASMLSAGTITNAAIDNAKTLMGL